MHCATKQDGMAKAVPVALLVWAIAVSQREASCASQTGVEPLSLSY